MSWSKKEILRRALATKSFRYNAIAAEATVKTGVGLLHTVVIGIAGDATSRLILRDGTAGTIITTIDGSKVGTYIFDSVFTTSLTREITGTTAPDLTINVG